MVFRKPLNKHAFQQVEHVLPQKFSGWMPSKCWIIEPGQFAGAVRKMIFGKSKPSQHGKVQVRHRCFGRILDMAAGPDRSPGLPRQNRQ